MVWKCSFFINMLFLLIKKRLSLFLYYYGLLNFIWVRWNILKIINLANAHKDCNKLDSTSRTEGKYRIRKIGRGCLRGMRIEAFTNYRWNGQRAEERYQVARLAIDELKCDHQIRKVVFSIYFMYLPFGIKVNNVPRVVPDFVNFFPYNSQITVLMIICIL